MMKNSKAFGMRSLIALVFTILSCFGLTACGSDESDSEGSAHDTVMSTVSDDDQGQDQPSTGEVVVLSDISSAGDWGEDDYVVNATVIAGDTLTVGVSYSGGCEEHGFTLVISESFVETEPVRLAAFLAHDGNEDSCEAWVTETYAFDLGVIKTLYQKAYQQSAGTVVLLLDGIGIPEERRIIYEFGS